MVGLSGIKQGARVILVIGNNALEKVPLRRLYCYIAGHPSNIPFLCIMGDGTIDGLEAAVPRDSSPHYIYKR
jgi:hypothetical protein